MQGLLSYQNVQAIIESYNKTENIMNGFNGDYQTFREIYGTIVEVGFIA